MNTLDVSTPAGFAALEQQVRPLLRTGRFEEAEALLAPHVASGSAPLPVWRLLVSVGSSPVHLAGAIGVPTWVMLPFVPDWRWLTARADSPWYPATRLFRQPRRGDWTSVAAKIGAQLAALVARAEHRR